MYPPSRSSGYGLRNEWLVANRDPFSLEIFKKYDFAFSERPYQNVYSSTVVVVFSQNLNKIVLSLELEPQINCQQLPRTQVSDSRPPCAIENRQKVQAKIPQNRPNFRVFDIFGQSSGRRTPPPYFGAVETKRIGHFLRKTPFCRRFEFWGKTAAKIRGDPANSAVCCV